MAEITEQQIYEAFGLSENTQEVADPATINQPETVETGEQVQEVAEPASGIKAPEGADSTESTADTAAPGKPAGQAAGIGTGDKQPQTPEQRRENAARRRETEKAQAVEQALEQERQKQSEFLKDFFAKAGLKNTTTGQPITTMEEFQAWSAEFEQKKLNRELKEGKLTAEGLETAISSHPVVKQAQALLEKDRQEKRAREEAEAKTRIDAEITEIHKLDASISTLEDLFNAPYGQELYAMTRRGYSLKDAHYLLNRERLEKAKAEAIRQQSMSNTRSKEHLNATTNTRGGGSLTVPAADLAMYRQFNPNATDAEIQAHYNSYMKR